jgi:glycine cleavage system H protein
MVASTRWSVGRVDRRNDVQIPEDLRYTKDHEWLRVEAGIGTIGISDYAQGELTDITFVELPEVGTELKKGDSFGTVDGIKAVSEVYSPVDGTVTEVNGDLEDQPELINDEPYGKGWMIRIELADESQTDAMLDSTAYAKLIEE